MADDQNTDKKIFDELNPENVINEIESLCMNCEKNGTTRLLFTKIPFFREIILMSFECPECGYKSTEIQPGSALADTGILYDIKVVSSRDMNRRVVKSEYATIKIPDLDLEIPPQTQKGKLTTIEGFIANTKDNIEKTLQEGYYNELGDETISKIKNFLDKLENALNQKVFPFHFTLDDPSGNSFVENPYAPSSDPYASITNYIRTTEQLKAMGLYFEELNNESNPQEKGEEKKETPKEENDAKNKEKVKIQKTKHVYTDEETKKLLERANELNKKNYNVYSSKNHKISAHLIDFTKSIENNADLEQECLVFQTDCFCCGAPGENKMCMCTIPYFKELIITCFTCEKCGFKTAEVKGGGGFSEKATKMVFRKEKTEDLCRDIFKSETAKISIPELNFETDTGSMGGMFTTVEGVLSKILDNLENVPFSFGDSKENSSMEDFLNEFRSYLTQDKKFTLIIDDPLSNSFIFSPLFPNKDPQLDVIEYERTWEQNEELGINDMKVENYVVSHENNLNTVENNVEESKTEELPIENKEESSNTVGRSKGG